MLRDSQIPFLCVIIAMSSVALVATDIYLPALPEMSLYFKCTQSDIQSSFTIFLLGLALCQLIYGFLADRIGRKKIALIGLSLFVMASLLCAHANTLMEFLLYRLLQSMGGGVGSVISRAMIADRFDRTESVRVFSTIFPIVSLSTAIAPFVGGYLTAYYDWRATFYCMAGFGGVVWLSIIVLLTECREATRARSVRLELNKMNYTASNLFGYRAVICNLNFLGYALIICSVFSVFRCFYVEAPFVFSNQGYLPEEIGSLYIFLTMTYILGNLFARKSARTLGVDHALSTGFKFFIVGGLCMVGGTFIFSTSPYALVLPMAVIAFGNGLLFPSASAAAMSTVSVAVSGIGSGLVGALQFIVAAICIHWVGKVCQGHALLLSFFISSIILIGFCSYRWLVPRL